jgi:hypothetical protein
MLQLWTAAVCHHRLLLQQQFQQQPGMHQLQSQESRLL